MKTDPNDTDPFMDALSELGPIMTAEELAAILRCSVKSIRRLACNGTIRAIRRHHSGSSPWLFLRKDVAAYLASNSNR